VTGAVIDPEPVLLPQIDTATRSEFATGVKLAVVTLAVVADFDAGALASSAIVAPPPPVGSGRKMRTRRL
jgi:hypothetical protein